MEKANNLRAWLLENVPGLRDDPTLFSIYLEQGSIAARAHADKNLSFVYRFKLLVDIWSFSGDTDLIVIALLDWIRCNQPDLLQRADTDDVFTFEAEIIDTDHADLRFTIDVDEAVSVEKIGDGSYTAKHVMPDVADIGDCDADSVLSELSFGDALVIKHG